MNEPIYVAIFNFSGSSYDLLQSYAEKLVEGFSKECSVSLINGDTLCFFGLEGQEVSDLMESTGADYNYSYESPKAAWNIDGGNPVKIPLSDQILSANTRSAGSHTIDKSLAKETAMEC